MPNHRKPLLATALLALAKLSGKGYQINLPWCGRYPWHSSPLIEAVP
ncbi:hypothetical protein QA640_37565 [Bradyrhizobium sp. CB82]|nr:hypothetical protein [Bradyrhizobium sp. CB82]WFU39942.1 hypothetical protein QA640_37565 [Bradyrhizobium sp. CB82]